ncbi:MAG: hypothetical protein RXR43_02415 [Sulfolobus sp.]
MFEESKYTWIASSSIGSVKYSIALTHLAFPFHPDALITKPSYFPSFVITEEPLMIALVLSLMITFSPIHFSNFSLFNLTIYVFISIIFSL